jgi:four helix bundle protein
MRDHKKLRAFQHADDLAILTYCVTRAFPKSELFGLTSQMRRGAVSVASNIVEGCARRTEADYLHFLDIAYGCAKELQYQGSLAFRLGYLKEAAYDRFATLCEEAARTLNGLLNSLRNRGPRP